MSEKVTDDPWIDMEVGEVRHFKTRLAKGGVYVPSTVFIRDGDRDELGELTSDQIYGAEVNGHTLTDHYEIMMVYPFFIQIEKKEHSYLSDLIVWAEDNEETSPFADATKKVNFNEMKLPF